MTTSCRAALEVAVVSVVAEHSCSTCHGAEPAVDAFVSSVCQRCRKHRIRSNRSSRTTTCATRLTQQPALLLIGTSSYAQVEEAALSKEKDKVSQERLDDVRKEVAALQDELQPLLSRYNKERARLQELRRLRKKREDLQVGGRNDSDTRLAHQLVHCDCHSRSRASSRPAAAARQTQVWYAAQSRGLAGWPGQ